MELHALQALAVRLLTAPASLSDPDLAVVELTHDECKALASLIDTEAARLLRVLGG